MTPEYTNQVVAGMLILSLSSVLILGLILSLLVITVTRRGRLGTMPEARENSDAVLKPRRYQPTVFDQPCRWLVIRSSNLGAVQAAFDLHNPTPCSWVEGISQLSQHNLFIAPPINGWILVIGQGLPDPAEDVDDCYRFIVRLSREFGHVQFYVANRAVNHHAWVRAEEGWVRRAYAWAGETVWNQGQRAQAEIDLGLKCFDYGESPLELGLVSGDTHHANAEKVLFLASRWSFDPTSIDETMQPAAQGISGDLLHSRQL
jgi:hypothetical protein